MIIDYLLMDAFIEKLWICIKKLQQTDGKSIWSDVVKAFNWTEK